MELPKNLKLLIFDFDGTLFHLDGIDWGAIRSAIAQGDEKLGDAIERLNRTKDPLLEMVTKAELNAVGSARVAADVADTLGKLGASYNLAIVTRNSQRTVALALGDAAAGIYIIGREAVEHLKPHPEGVQRALRHFAVSSHQAALVGDTYHDVEAARASGVYSVVVANDRLPYRPEGADYYIASIPELAGL